MAIVDDLTDDQVVSAARAVKKLILSMKREDQLRLRELLSADEDVAMLSLLRKCGLMNATMEELEAEAKALRANLN